MKVIEFKLRNIEYLNLTGFHAKGAKQKR